MRKISAHYIFPVTSPPVKNGVLILDDNEKVIGIEQIDKNHENSSVEFYNGVIVPGFVNAHCHLELSYMKSKIEQGIGFAGFIKNLVKIRDNENNEKILDFIEKYDNIMYKKGVVAVGDIVNTDYTIEIKKNSNIYYHSFIEIFASNPLLAEKTMLHGLKMLSRYNENNLSASISPHAPYSISPKLFQMIYNFYIQLSIKHPVSIHNQETQDEDKMFANKTGSVAEFIKSAGTDLSIFPYNLSSSLAYTTKYIPNDFPIILVHNTYTKKPDLDLLKDFKKYNLCLCPKANIYIENRLPDIKILESCTENICLGTDSLASNNTLDILEEMKVISENYPQISFQKLLEWATINGARALLIDNSFGSFEPGKRPGVVLIENIDLESLKLKPDSVSSIL